MSLPNTDQTLYLNIGIIAPSQTSDINEDIPITHPTVFISYSQKDEQEKNALLRQLGSLQRQGLRFFGIIRGKQYI